MIVRLINPEEWELLKPVYLAEKGPMPHLGSATAAIAIDEKGVAGFWAAYPVIHAGPLWIRPDRRGTGLWRDLNMVLEDNFIKTPMSGYFVMSGEPKVEAIFSKLGFIPMPYKPWKREF